MEEIRLWRVAGDKLEAIHSFALDYEKRLEEWLSKDISVLSPDLLMIARKVKTDTGKELDLLAMNSLGEMIIIELKKEKTPRQVTAQVLDYASWVRTITIADIEDLIPDECDIETMFHKKWPKSEFPEIVNSSHRMLIVGADIDDATKRIVEYLVEEYGVPINAVCFSFFRDDSDVEFLAKSFLIQEEEVEQSYFQSKMQRGRKKDVLKRLLVSGVISIGDTLFFKPALEKGHKKTDVRVSAKIVNDTRNCLQINDDSETLYTLSRLRKKMIEELNIEGIDTDWGFGVRFDWMTSEEKTLADLIEKLDEQ